MQAEGALGPGAYHIVLRRTADGETTTQETYTDADGYKTTETLADIVTSWGEFEGRGWYRNANGFVQVVTGAFAEHDPLENAVRDMAAPRSGATLLGVTSDTPAAYVVKVCRETALLKRATTTPRRIAASIDLTGYEGIRIRCSTATTGASRGGWYRGCGRYTADYYKGERRFDVVTYAPVPTSAVNLAIPQSTTLFDLQGRASVTIPADFTPDGIIVRMNVGQRGLDLVLDSGSSTIA